ncbi:metal ABC transporter permease [Acidiluteibacter ferrifornacis]|uniref:Iron chelate uptake ABC transporter family permease subunit n=1 Tax=Acidiluteibacter ferrifornacis TaxID=2692424 RepID=A0A6N9NII4_9FLAO|nr:metal ABC transporter permease [Acidiluteibacter ferrifornacis]NBG65642.1 iron chelate uptake ABC transporter family permease subunit [Acidiluteibacter ferrifornacis]
MASFWIILTGTLIAISCSLLGCYLILRKMAMVGDAISHAVLPGIVLAFLFSGSRETIPMLIGAACLGVLTTVIIELFHRKARLQSDAAIGITFTWLFAIGIILISFFADNIDLDQDCVLYGEIAMVPLDIFYLASGVSLGPRPVWIGGVTLILIVTFIIWGYKGLFITSFNEEYAKAIGISAAFWHYALMSSVSLTTVVAFESVGAILVVAFLIVPAATAYLIVDDLKKMLLLSALFGTLSAISGYYLAYTMDGSIAGAMATMTGIFFTIVFIIQKIRAQKATQVPNF